MDPRIIQDFKNSWRNVNAATVGFLTCISTDKLQTKPFDPRFKNYAWEFSCIIRTRYCYLYWFKTGELKFNNREGIPNKDELATKGKSDLLDLLSHTTNEMISVIENIKSPDGIRMVTWILQHERIHHGKLILYLSKDGYEIPQSFVKTWGESNFKKQK